MILLKRYSFKTIINHKFFSLSSYNLYNEITKIVDPYSNVLIKSDLNIKIKPFDLLDCPDANKIRATFIPIKESYKKDKIPDITKEIEIKINEQNVNINDLRPEERKKEPNIMCLLEVPIKSNLNIESKNNIKISDMYSDTIKALAHSGSIFTKNLKSTSIDLSTTKGNINCSGLTLAQKIDVHVKEIGNIFLDKLQGDLLYAKVFNGDIKVNSSYIEKSNFACEKGNLFLKNIHKSSEVFVLKQGNIEMSGIHGNIYINSKGGDLNLQFSEIVGDNIIVANKSKNVTINVSDLVELNSYIELHSDKIQLEESVKHLMQYLLDEKHFEYGDKNKKSKLMICSAGLLKFGKMSWADSVKSQMGIA